jgi:hypothetical protein
MDTLHQPPSRWAKILRILFYVLGLPALAIICFYAEEDARGKGDWNAFKHQWEAKGENFDPASFIPAPVPDDKNFALAPIVYDTYRNILMRDGKVIPEEKRDPNFTNRLNLVLDSSDPDIQAPITNGIGDWGKSRLSDLNPWRTYYRDLSGATNLFPVPPEPQTPAKDVLLALSIYDPAIEELRQASLLPYSRFPLTYGEENPASILLPHLAHLKGISLFLQMRTLAELQNGDSRKALDDIKLSLRVVDATRTESFLISHLVRIAQTTIALQPVYEGLAQHQWSDAQLTELDSELAKLDFVSDYKFSMRGETVFFQQGIFDYMRHHPEKLLDFSATDYDPRPQYVHFLGYLIPSGWYYQNQARCARMMFGYYIPVADVKTQTISPTMVRAADATFTADTAHLTPYNIAERLLLPALGNAARRFAYAQGSVNLARTAIALERFRLATGKYPASLDDLKSQHLPVPPHDVINGLPLHYSLTNGASFILYSVGWNETDDGGQVVLRESGSVDLKLGDWVWKYPAL